ncbi:hypothetical protein FGO68_gene9928 [Halteria grandinella]|uniref:Transmembrane protein n=1 Tax=Halteria grandinella TaxID=5974 RepID=A0A8J8NWZ0_HALGN|nr:hypothetical protein FGO68_gene9928 [Halteria grandinella]
MKLEQIISDMFNSSTILTNQTSNNSTAETPDQNHIENQILAVKAVFYAFAFIIGIIIVHILIRIFFPKLLACFRKRQRKGIHNHNDRQETQTEDHHQEMHQSINVTGLTRFESDVSLIDNERDLQEPRLIQDNPGRISDLQQSQNNQNKKLEQSPQQQHSTPIKYNDNKRSRVKGNQEQ